MSSDAPLPSRRVLGLSLSAALGVALVGFFTGTRTAPEPAGYRHAEASAHDEAALAPRQRDMGAVRYLGRRQEQSKAFDELRRAPRALEDSVAPTPEEYARAVAKRSIGRAYDGAPPTVPHPVDAREAPNCLMCHERGMRVKGKVATPMSHEPYASCLQCHTTREAPLAVQAQVAGGAFEAMENTFVGRVSDGRGPRSYPGAPPQMPHKSFMRERCTSCHGAWADGLASSHAARQNCVQCHTPFAGSDQAPRSTFARLPGLGDAE